MAQSGFGFFIAAAPATDGRVLMVASQCVRDIEIKHDYDSPDMIQWGGNRINKIPARDTTIAAKIVEPSHHPESLVHLNDEQGGYAEAWRRLFDIWVPPQFTDETRSQILTHYT